MWGQSSFALVNGLFGSTHLGQHVGPRLGQRVELVIRQVVGKMQACASRARLGTTRGTVLTRKRPVRSAIWKSVI